MTEIARAAPLDASGEISHLIKLLHSTDQRLEELLAGEVDSVTDIEGRTILLRHAQGRIRESEVARQAAILNALPAQIALVDRLGVIVSVNEAWRRFADENGMRAPGHAVGASYLGICDAALGPDSKEAREVAAGLRAVLDGEAENFSIEYPCHSPTQLRWFALTVTPLSHGASNGAVVMHVDISARKRADNALAALSEKTERRERLLSTTLGSISDFAYAYDRDCRFMYANQPCLDMWGMTLEEVIGRDFLELGYPPALAAKLRREVRQVFDDRIVVSDETPYVTPTGRAGIYEYIFSPAFAADGSVDFVVGCTRDITQRKLAETALRESAADFEALAEAMPQIVFVTRPDGENVYLNRRWTDYTGRSREEGFGTGGTLSIHPDDRQGAIDDWTEARKTDGLYSTELRLRAADGSYRWWLVRGVAIKDDAGITLKWIGTSTDIDKLKLAELEIKRTNRELQRQREELRALFDLVPAMIWFKDTKNNILRVNQRVAKMLGKPVEEVEGHTTAEIYPTKAARLYEEDLEVIRTGIAQPPVPELVTDGRGTLMWIERAKVPYHDETGAVIGIVVMGLDVSDRMRDQAALRELNTDLEVRVRARTAELNLARDEAEQASLAKSAFLATMSHEIRTPMNGVIGMIEVLQQTSLQAYQVEMIDLIRDSAFSLLGIIEDILDFSRIEAGKLAVENEPMRLADTVENVCGMVDHLAMKRGVRMTTFVDPAIPALVMGDENRLRQVLVNLTGNAIKFSGGRMLCGNVAMRAVLVGRDGDDVTVDLSVADDGIGMDEATLARLFTPFSQADASTTRRFGGSGLGLAISSMLVSLMGGTISVASAPEHGATFTVRLTFTAVGSLGSDAGAGPSPAGLHCRIVGRARPLGDDLAAYLTHAQMAVARSPDLASAASSEPPPGIALWLLLPDVAKVEHAKLRAMAPRVPGSETRFVVLGWGGRRRPRVEADDIVSLDADTLLRRALFRAVALASGRMQEEPMQEVPQAGGPHSAPSRETARQQRRLILVAEDNEINRVVIVRQLEMIGLAAEVAVDGQDALQRWRSGDFALVLTDLHMPQLDGYALTRAIRSEELAGNRTPIIALTANALRDEELRCLATGMDAYLSKPVRISELRETIEAWLDPAARAALPASAAPAPAPPAATPPADLNVLVALVGDDPAVIDEVLRCFRESAVQSREEVSRGLLDSAGSGVVEAAHKLKSAALSIGALRVGDLCSRIEATGLAGRTDELKAMLPLFLTELDAVLAFLDSR